MEIEDVYRFEQLAKLVGNRYTAVKFISRRARQLGISKREYHLFESKLIQWVLSGKCPYTSSEMERRKLSCRYDELSDLLEWVDDVEVANEVRYCYRQSVRNRALTYCESNKLNEGRRTRVNVLLRMAWYSSFT